VTTVAEDNSGSEFNSDNAELYETLAHPTRILILQTLADHPLRFAELKRLTNIESSGNLSFHLNKLGSLVKADPEGNYCLTDEGKEAIRVVEATERLSRQTRSESRLLKSSRIGRRESAILLTLAILLGVSMITTGSFLASQSQVMNAGSGVSPTNFTLPPGGTKFWFGEGGGVSSTPVTMHFVYVMISSPYSPMSIPEFRISTVGAVNGTIFSAQSDYVDASYTIPKGTTFVNYTISNPTDSPITVVAAYIQRSVIDHPNQGTGDLLLYLGAAVVITGVGIIGTIALLGQTRKANA
jgi:DNA-binding HxlR family transcriptional regulator